MGSVRKNEKGPGNPWTKGKNVHRKANGGNANLNKDVPKSEHKFKEAQKKLQAAVEKYANQYESSSDEEDLQTTDIVGSILRSYEQTGGATDQITRTQLFIENSLSSSASTCLICISTIKRTEPIWNCSECYCSFHLTCIQRWAKDTIVQQKQALEEPVQIRQIQIVWGCPKCRHDYEPSEIPAKYECYCKKTADPGFQQFVAPHSCGEICRKGLKPFCGHQCVLLCHPGPCPPCPKTVNVTCHCGSQIPRPQRCSNKEWSCGSECNKLLLCGKHKCTQPCHANECPPCPKKSIQKCQCGDVQKLRDCSSPVWQCEKVCDKLLDCSLHSCPEICHAGACDACFLTKLRTCPCGKSSHVLPCTEDTPVCDNTCAKTLECGMHVCQNLCHKDKCRPCLETVTKYCRCGLRSKQIQCEKVYLCDTKCKQVRDCNKHPCNRKCCDGNCPPCEKPCGRTLKCGKHKCSSICHRGPCYPCSLTEIVSCRCGRTTITVPCGRKAKTRPPKCNKLCMMPPDCHHGKREDHKCHFGDCPPCRQVCRMKHQSCSHECVAPCHSAVLVQIQGHKPIGPWEQPETQIEVRNLPCPDCMVPVAVTCLGKHETSKWPCHMAKPSSCHRPCGRLLLCANHTCSYSCHDVQQAPDDRKAGTNCEKCEKGCSKPRPEGCQHTCPKPCHEGTCPPCKNMLRTRCHCGLNQPYVSCTVWTSTHNKEELQSCGNQCPKNFECGHRCRSNCHSGECPNSNLCRKKMKFFCACKRIKKEFSCETVRKNEAFVECDNACLQKIAEEKEMKALESERKRKQEELNNMRELEKYEKKFQGKRRTKERRVVDEVDERSMLAKYWFVVAVPGVVIAVAFIYMVLVVS